MPGHKPAARRKKPAGEEKKPRRKRTHGFARPRMEEPTAQVSHAPDFCPECHTTLSGADRGMYFILRLTQLIVRPDSRLGMVRYKIAPKCLLPGPFSHSSVGGNSGVAGTVRSYNLVFTYPCQPERGMGAVGLSVLYCEPVPRVAMDFARNLARRSLVSCCV